MVNSNLVRVKDNTHELMDIVQKKFIELNPEYENINFSKDKIIYEVFKNYDKILQELIDNGIVQISVKK